MREIFVLSWPAFPKRPRDVRRFPTICRRLPNIVENVRRCPDDLSAFAKLSFYEVFVIVCISVLYKIIDFMYPDFAEILLVPIALSPSFKQGLAGSTIIIWHQSKCLLVVIRCRALAENWVKTPLITTHRSSQFTSRWGMLSHRFKMCHGRVYKSQCAVKLRIQPNDQEANEITPWMGRFSFLSDMILDFYSAKQQCIK